MTPEEQAALDAAQEKQIRELAAQITQMSKLGFDPLTIRKGVVAAVADTTTPPTVSINISGDATTLVSAVRTLNNYTPVVGQTVLVGKQGSEIFLLGAISAANPTSVNNVSDNGWIRADLSNGTHGGNSNGDIYYRRVLDHGSWKMQWRGGWAPAGATLLLGSGKELDPDYRPTSKRSIICARQIQTGQIGVQFDFHSSGQVELVGPTISTGSNTATGFTETIDPNDSTTVALSGYLSQAGSDLGHSHGVVGGHWHDVTVNSHSHTASAPTWVSLNGIEYFL